MKVDEVQRARRPEDIETPSSRVSPMPVGQSHSRSNRMVSPKSSIRSRRSRRNRVATRRNREDGGAGGQQASSPSVATFQSQNLTNVHDDSFRAATQLAPLANDSALRPNLALHPHQRRMAHTSMSYAPRMDLHSTVPAGDQQQVLSPGLISFYGCQTHPTESINQSPALHISAREPDLSPR